MSSPAEISFSGRKCGDFIFAYAVCHDARDNKE